jgi:hypothetical protein
MENNKIYVSRCDIRRRAAGVYALFMGARRGPYGPFTTLISNLLARRWVLTTQNGVVIGKSGRSDLHGRWS